MDARIKSRHDDSIRILLLEDPAGMVADGVEGLVDGAAPPFTDGLEIRIVIFEPGHEVFLQRVAAVDQKIDGRPTETFERMVESKEISAHLAASLMLVPG